MNEEKYRVAVTVIYKGNYDPTNGTLYPVVKADIRKTKPFKGCVKTIYLDAEEHIGRAFGKQEYFGGQNKSIRYKVMPSQRYKKAVKQLHDTFAFNNVMWTTVNTGYFDKFYDVYTEDSPDDSGMIDFEEYSRYIREDYIPLWNIEVYTCNSRGTEDPMPGKRYFEYALQKKRGCEKDGYMAGVQKDIQDVVFRGNNIYIRSCGEVMKKWKVYRFAADISIDSFGYEKRLLFNHRKEKPAELYAIQAVLNRQTRNNISRKS